MKMSLRTFLPTLASAMLPVPSMVMEKSVTLACVTPPMISAPPAPTSASDVVSTAGAVKYAAGSFVWSRPIAVKSMVELPDPGMEIAACVNFTSMLRSL